MNAARQRGMAIISALLIAAVVAVIAAAMLSRQTVFTRTLEAEQLRLQGHWLLEGGVTLSRQRLWDARKHDLLTRPDQAWAQPIRLPGTDGFEGQMEDEQGKFNLRNLIRNGRVDSVQQAHFERLCRLLGVSPALSQRISARVLASYPRQVGAAVVQSGFQSGRDTSPDSASTLIPATYSMLRSLDDLRVVEGVDEALVARLSPFVTLLPANTWVNGNTSRAEVLAAVVPGLSLERAQALISQRNSGQWFINRGDFVNRLRMPEVAVDSVQVGITSDWFLLHGQVRQAQRRVRREVLLHRDEDQQPRAIWSKEGA